MGPNLFHDNLKAQISGPGYPACLEQCVLHAYVGIKAARRGSHTIDRYGGNGGQIIFYPISGNTAADGVNQLFRQGSPVRPSRMSGVVSLSCCRWPGVEVFWIRESLTATT